MLHSGEDVTQTALELPMGKIRDQDKGRDWLGILARKITIQYLVD
jgi:hypothetical protein